MCRKYMKIRASWDMSSAGERAADQCLEETNKPTGTMNATQNCIHKLPSQTYPASLAAKTRTNVPTIMR